MTHPTPLSPTACDKCRLTTTLPDLLQLHRRSFRPASAALKLCPRCLQETQDTINRNILIIEILAIVIPFALWLFSPDRSSFYVFVLACVIIEILMLILHELAHALAARTVGLHVLGISLGTGPRLYRINSSWGFLDLHPYPVIGICWTVAPPYRLQPWRSAVTTAAGPLVHFLVLLFLAVLWLFNSQWLGSPWSQALLWINLIMLVYSLYPHDVDYHGTKLSNDGKQLLRLLKSDPPTQEIDFNYFVLEIETRLQRRQFREAQDSFARLQALQPDAASLRTIHMLLLFSTGQWPELQTQAQEALASSTDQTQRILPAHWLAYALLYQGKPPAQIEPYVEELVQIIPFDAAVQSAHAFLNLAQNRLDQAQASLDRSDRYKYLPDTFKAVNAQLHAHLCALKGDSAQEQHWRTIAAHLDPTATFRIPT